MGSEGLVKHSGLTISPLEMSGKRSYQDQGDNCEAEDLSMPVRKKLKAAQTSKHGTKGEQSRRDQLKHNIAGTIQSLAIEMDIKEPLTTLQSLVEERIGVRGLSSSGIFLQGKIKMNPASSLGDQCIKSDGRAEIKMEVTVVLGGISRINIVDVLRLSQDDDEEDQDDLQEEECEDTSSVEDLSIKTNNNYNDGQLDDRSGSESSCISDSSSSPRSSPFPWCILHDVVSLFPITLPKDPLGWTIEHTQHWLRWALKEFNIKFVDDSMWALGGEELSQITEEEFHKKVPLDPKKLFWTHTELLRKCQIFAVPDKSGQRSQATIGGNEIKATKKTNPRKPRPVPMTSIPSGGNGNLRRATMTGHNGQIQLWQFLLELLGDKSSKNVIQWVGREGEFKLNDPELVAQMWGQRKNKPKMNYEKLSRALRYYYSEAMIAKVHGRRFVYKFVCNLKELIGYSTEELINLVDEESVGVEAYD